MTGVSKVQFCKDLPTFYCNRDRRCHSFEAYLSYKKFKNFVVVHLSYDCHCTDKHYMHKNKTIKFIRQNDEKGIDQNFDLLRFIY